MPFKEDERIVAVAERAQADGDHLAADALALQVRANANRAQDQHILQSTRGIEDRVGVEDMPDQTIVTFGDEGKALVPRP